MNLSIKNTGNAAILRHYVTTEIGSRGLDAKTAAQETARAFGKSFDEIERIVLDGTDAGKLSHYEEILTGKLEIGDLVLSTAAGTENAKCSGAFDFIDRDAPPFDTYLRVEQLNLVLRRKDGAETEQPAEHNAPVDVAAISFDSPPRKDSRKLSGIDVIEYADGRGNYYLFVFDPTFGVCEIGYGYFVAGRKFGSSDGIKRVLFSPVADKNNLPAEILSIRDEIKKDFETIRTAENGYIWAVEFWGSMPDNGNDDCFSGVGFDSFDQAKNAFENFARAVGLPFNVQDAAVVSLVNYSAGHRTAKRINEPGKPARKDNSGADGGADAIENHERRFQNAMVFGADGWNDASY